MIENKLSSKAGETLAETLVAALIGGIGLLLLATMIMTATHVVNMGEQKVTAVYKDMEYLDQGSGEGLTTTDTKIKLTWKISAGESSEKSILIPVTGKTTESVDSYEAK